MALTPKQERFVAEYLVDLNATQAAIRAGYSPKTARNQASDLLAKPNIAAAVAAANDRRQRQTGVTAEVVLGELLRLARVDIGEAFNSEGGLLPIKQMPEDVRRAISGVDVEELFDGFGKEREQIGVVRKVRFWDKGRALELLGKHLRLFIERVEHSADSDLARALAEARERVKATP